MNLFVVMKLSDSSLRNMISPIADLDMIQSIRVIRDTKGPDIKKVLYSTPGSWIQFFPSLVAIPGKLIYIVWYSIIEKPALIHSFLFFPHGLIALIAGKLTRRKTGLSLIAGPVELHSVGGSPLGTYSYCRPLPAPNLKSRVIVSLLKQFDVITVPGSFSREYLLARGLDASKVFTVHHVIDDQFRPMNLVKDLDVVYVGRLAPVKHIETFIQAIKMVSERFPAVRAAIVGTGECRPYLEKLTSEYGLNDNIQFAGYQESVIEWYNRSRLSILASEREGFPYTIIESLKCGVPVVTSNCGDVTDIVRDGFNGRIVNNYRDHQGFAEAILDLLQNPVRLSEFSENSLLSIKDLTPDKIGEQWMNVFRAIN